MDAATAQAAGTDFAGVLHGMTTREELEAYPHVAIVDDLGVSCPSRFDVFAQYKVPSP